jgi:hypothetical protein
MKLIRILLLLCLAAPLVGLSMCDEADDGTDQTCQRVLNRMYDECGFLFYDAEKEVMVQECIDYYDDDYWRCVFGCAQENGQCTEFGSCIQNECYPKS